MKRSRGGNTGAQPSIRSFFASTKGTGQQQQQQPAEADPVTARKRQKQAVQSPVDSDCVIVLDDADGDVGGQTYPQQAQQAAAAAPPAKPAARQALPSQRDAAAHGKAQAKLVAFRDDEEPSGAQQQQQQQVAGRAAGRQAPKYTPLEQQVVALQKQHPGVLLLVEVGYKMRLFGKDAEVASKELGIYCYLDHNFMTASFPVPRLPIHVRRLVAAGHKVGVVRQTESAALKAAGDNKSAPFTRSLTGLFTAATLEAAEKADKLDEAGAMEVSQGLEALLGGSGRATAASFALVVAQDMSAAAAAGGKAGAAAASEAAAGGLLGLLAVDAGSGDIAYGLGSTDSSRADRAPNSSSGEAPGVMPLESVLLALTPSDIVVVEPVSAATERVLQNYLAGASRCCRLERQQQRQLSSRGPAATSNTSPPPAAATAAAAAAGGYLDARMMSDLVDFFGGAGDDSRTAGAEGTNPTPAPTAAAAAAAAGGDGGQASSSESCEASLQFILSLPQPVLAALAGALAYLRPFGLAGVLRCTSSYRALAVAGAMALGGSALTQLEVLEAGGEGQRQLRGSLLHVLDRCSTAAGGRMLRRWLAAPLADRSSILDRQQAVQVLLDSITGEQQASSSGGNGSPCAVLQQLPQWLAAGRQDLERALARVAAGTAAPAEAVKLWTRLAELPQALQLPMQPPPTAADGAAPAAAAGGQPAASLDLDSLSAGVPSRLLVSLLAAAAGPDVAGPAAAVLDRLDAAAAAKNDYLQLFKSQQHFPEVFACRAAVAAAEAHLQALLPQLASTAGVRALSYVSIQNQGNFLVELPTARTDVPTGWQKVCATKKVCRYHPPEVTQGMAALARAQEQLQAACAAAWSTALRGFTAAHHAAFRAAVDAVAQLDALHSLALVASSPGYCRPQFVEEGEPQQLVVTDGKHPMLDLALEGGAVPNSLDLRWDGTRAAVITGPNMGGKSVLIRQAALLAIMAQVGSWVPAQSCRLSVLDGVFVRMGASDSLVLGRSTFAEELGEASDILAHATNRSLVIMDELGRGTATHDGVAIACSTLAHLVSNTQCLSLFVTHYPEVAALASSTQGSTAAEEQQPAAETAAGTVASGSHSSTSPGAGGDMGRRVSVYHMSYVRQDPVPQQQQAAAEAAAAASTSLGTNSLAAAEADPTQAAGAAAAAGADAAGGEASEAVPTITFLYKLAEGAADESFGLNVAQMAGLPSSVVQRAAVVARQLKSRLATQQQQQQQQQPPEQQQQQPLPEQQHESAVVPDLMARVYQALKEVQQGDDSQASGLQQLQASAVQALADVEC